MSSVINEHISFRGDTAFSTPLQVQAKMSQVFQPSQGTSLYNNSIKNNLITINYSFQHWPVRYPLTNQSPRDPATGMPANSVESSSPGQQTWRDTSGPTLESSHTSANTVSGPFQSPPISRGMSGTFTTRRNLSRYTSGIGRFNLHISGQFLLLTAMWHLIL